MIFAGGLGSATCASTAKEQGFSLYSLSFNYRQKHSAELVAAKALAKELSFAKHDIVKLDSTQFKGSALVEAAI